MATRHRAQRARIARLARKGAAREWRNVDGADIRGSWVAVQPRVATILKAAQHKAADESNGYLDRALRAQGFDSPEAQVIASAFAGVASDGRDLASLLQSPLIQSLMALAQGASVPQALAIGGSVLDRIVGTQTIDAGRVADGVGITASTVLRGYVRIAAPPCCARCAILGGEFYRWSSGFERHPYCDCFHVPVYGTNYPEAKSGIELFRSGEIRGMSKADVQAVKDGADLNQVVNARRGMSSAAGRKVTAEGTTRRGYSGQLLRGNTRLMPEQIYREAAGNREAAIQLLRSHGFIF